MFWYWLRRYRRKGRQPYQKLLVYVCVEMEEAPIETVLAEVIYPDGTRLVFKERVGIGLLQSLLPKL